MSVVCSTDLAKHWADNAGLQPFSFGLWSNELVVVRGRSGSGKSTLLALLASDLLREVLYRNGLARDWGIYRGMWLVYSTTAAIALLGGLARGTRSPAVMALTTLGGSCVFFLITNFGV